MCTYVLYRHLYVNRQPTRRKQVAIAVPVVAVVAAGVAVAAAVARTSTSSNSDTNTNKKIVSSSLHVGNAVRLMHPYDY